MRVLFVLLAALTLAGALGPSLALAQMPALPHDPGLIDKLLTRNFDAIGDDNGARIDILIVFTVLGDSGCRAPRPGRVSAAEYVRYLNSDSRTGQHPSRDSMALGAMRLFGDPRGLNPNAVRMAGEIDRS
jgi:hypothetical protein